MSVSCECCVLSVEISALVSSLVQKNPTECGVSECDPEASTMRKNRPIFCEVLASLMAKYVVNSSCQF
jgi:hypothetical protein